MMPKYRAWHKPTQLMDDVVLIDFYNEKIGILYADPFIQGESIQKYNFNEIVLMQSTGLKGKDGVEIYEGDIVETPSSKAKYLVDYVEGSFVGRIKYREYMTLYKGLKVIGNIYENSELLEG